jgi:hypothetical protein
MQQINGCVEFFPVLENKARYLGVLQTKNVPSVMAMNSLCASLLVSLACCNRA